MSSLLDTQILDDLIELSAEPDFMHRLVQGFVTDAEMSIQKIRQHYETEHDEELLSQLHALKGSAMNIGAASLVDLTSHIHRRVKGSDKSTLPQLLKQLENRFNETSSALFKYIE